MRENAVVTHAVSSSCHIWKKKDDEASRAEQTNQITKAHKLLILELDYVFSSYFVYRKVGNIANMYYYFKISKAE